MALLETEGLIGALLLFFWVWALIDVIATDGSLCRNMPKGIWLVLVIILFDIGALVWLLLGRPEGAGFAPGGSGGARRRRPAYKGNSPYGPDSAPRYLSDLDISDRRSEQLDARLAEWERTHGATPAASAAAIGGPAKPALDAWESELAQREHELRRRELERREADVQRRESELGE